MGILRKLELYLRAAGSLRTPNWSGLPVLPRGFLRDTPHNRSQYNEFLVWLEQLRLDAATVGNILDVGANHGDFARAASARFPAAHVWLFEPLPVLWPRLDRQAANRAGSWSVRPFALGATPGRLALQVSAGNDSIGSFLGFSDEYREMNPATRPASSVDSRIETLDGFCAAEALDRIDLMKIDVEGFESEVLAGGKVMLQRTRALIIEVSLARQAKDGMQPLLEILSQFAAAGLHLVNLVPSFFSPAEPWKPLEYNLVLRRSDDGACPSA